MGIDLPSGLGAYPVLQFFAGLVVLIIGVLAYAAGQRNKVAPPPATMEPTQVFLGGPMQQALEYLRDISQTLRRIEEGQRTTARELDKQTRINETFRDTHAQHLTMMAEIARKLDDMLHAKDRARR